MLINKVIIAKFKIIRQIIWVMAAIIIEGTMEIIDMIALEKTIE